MSDVQRYMDYAAAAADVLTTKWLTPDKPSSWIGQDYWITPTLCTGMVEWLRISGADKASYIETIDNARTAAEPLLTTCHYYDDLTVWGRLFDHTYNYLSTSPGEKARAEPFLADTRIVQQQLATAWTQACGGGVPWKRFANEGNFKATNATLGYMEISVALYLLEGDAAMLDDAKKAWHWIQQKRLVDDDGLVWGGTIGIGSAAEEDPDPCSLNPKNPPVVGQQGNPLGPLWDMYKATSETTFLDVAQRIVEGTMKRMVWADDGVLMTGVDAEWNSHDPDWQIKQTGKAPFKGIFCRYLGRFVENLYSLNDAGRAAAADSYTKFLKNNADVLTSNYPGGEFGMNWHSSMTDYQPPKGEGSDLLNAALQYSALAVFAATAQALGAAANAKA